MSSLPRRAARLLLSLFFLTQNIVLILLGTVVHGSAAEALGLPTGCRLRLLAVPGGMAKATPALVQGPALPAPHCQGHAVTPAVTWNASSWKTILQDPCCLITASYPPSTAFFHSLSLALAQGPYVCQHALVRTMSSLAWAPGTHLSR